MGGWRSGGDGLDVASNLRNLLSGGVPNQDPTIVPARDCSPVWQYHYCLHSIGVLTEFEGVGGWGSRVPDQDPPIGPARDHPAIGQHPHRLHHAVVTKLDRGAIGRGGFGGGRGWGGRGAG